MLFGLGGAEAGPGVAADRDEQDDAQGYLLVQRVESQQDEAVADQRDEKHADDRAPDRAVTAEDGGAADHDAASTVKVSAVPPLDACALSTREASMMPPSAAAPPLIVNVTSLIHCTRTPASRAASALLPAAYM